MRRSRPRQRSGASAKRLAALECLLDQALHTATEIRRKGRPQSTEIAAVPPALPPNQIDHPSLRALAAVSNQTAFANGPVWFDRLAARAREDLEDMRKMVHTPLREHFARASPAHDGDSEEAHEIEMSASFLGDVQTWSQTWSLLKEWWSVFSEYGAPHKNVWNLASAFVGESIVIVSRLLEVETSHTTTNQLPRVSLCPRRDFTSGPSVLVRSLHFLFNVLDNFLSACAKYCASPLSPPTLCPVQYNGDGVIVRQAIKLLWEPLCRYLSRDAALTPAATTASGAVIAAKLLRTLSSRSHQHEICMSMLRRASEATILCMARAPTGSCACARCDGAITHFGTLRGVTNPVHGLLEEARVLFCVASGKRVGGFGWLHTTQDKGAFSHAHSSFWRHLLRNQREAHVYGPAIFTRKRLEEFFLETSTLPTEIIDIVLDFAGRSVKSQDTKRLRSLREKKRPLYTSLYSADWEAISGQVLRYKGRIGESS